MKRKTFAEMVQQLGWIVIAPQSAGMETLPAHNLNFAEAFPTEQQRHLPDFANMFGFQHVGDKDPCGKNIFRHFLGAL